MAEADNGISARLRRLPVQLMLALINATAILVIVAAILSLVAIARIDHFAGNLVATMTEAVLSKVDLPSRGVLANLQALTAEVRVLGNALRETRAGENALLKSEIARLNESLTAATASVDRLANARSMLTDQAIGQLAHAGTDALMKLRGCSSGVGQRSSASAPDGAHNARGKVARFSVGIDSAVHGRGIELLIAAASGVRSATARPRPTKSRSH